ncbi:MAG: MBL fold metallo-hydrolase [Pseudomonadota bacterium]
MRWRTRFVVMTATIAALAACSEAASPAATSSASSSSFPRAEQPAACPSKGAALQVLGSGGPIAEGDRASTSYLFWIDGEPRLLIDAGAGSFLRFAQAGGTIASLDAILLSHLHVDHVGDLAGVLNSGGFEGRTTPLPMIGPDGKGRFPGTGEFLKRLLDKDSGAFSYNGGYLDGTEGKALLEPRDIPTEGGSAPAAGLDVSNDYSVMAHPVHHLDVPALGFVIEIEGKTIVIAGDQSFLSERFLTDLTASKPAILFAHHAISGAAGQPRGLHRTPAQIGELAAALEPARLVLTHNMKRSLGPIADSLSAIGENYSGPVSVAADLDCYTL